MNNFWLKIIETTIKRLINRLEKKKGKIDNKKAKQVIAYARVLIDLIEKHIDK